jgi:type IV pilus assembly protein PilN
MIKINLLSQAQSSGVDVALDDQTAQKQGAIKLVMILLPALGLFLYQEQNIPSLQARLSDIQNQLGVLKSFNTQKEESVNEIKKFKEDEARIQKRIAALERLQKNRNIEAKLLKLFSDIMPEKAWLTQVEIKDGRARLNGLAYTNNDVNSLAERLKSNILVAELQLNDIREEKIEGVLLMKFDFTCLLEARKDE